METGRTDEEDFGMAAIKYRRKKHKSYDRMVFSVVSHLALFVLAAICLLPFWLVISGSLSEQQSIRLNGYQLIPEQVSLEAYRMLFRIPEELINAYGVTILVTAVGTGLGLLVTSMASYVLANKNFRYRYQSRFILYDCIHISFRFIKRCNRCDTVFVH